MEYYVTLSLAPPIRAHWPTCELILLIWPNSWRMWHLRADLCETVNILQFRRKSFKTERFCTYSRGTPGEPPGNPRGTPGEPPGIRKSYKIYKIIQQTTNYRKCTQYLQKVLKCYCFMLFRLNSYNICNFNESTCENHLCGGLAQTDRMNTQMVPMYTNRLIQHGSDRIFRNATEMTASILNLATLCSSQEK